MLIRFSRITRMITGDTCWTALLPTRPAFLYGVVRARVRGLEEGGGVRILE